MSGLEVIGSVASVIQLAGTVYAISKTLYEVGDALSNAPSDIKSLARDLETFSEELHLLSSLLDGKHRYSDRVYKLTAKIIGDCATICVKIDRILRKLRTGTVWARVKWLYKEKETMKLLTRLRDLKLSLMGTLSLLSTLKADYMMYALGLPSASLLDGPRDEKLAEETVHSIEDTRKKLAGISVGHDSDASLSRETLIPRDSSTVTCMSSVLYLDNAPQRDRAVHGFSTTSTSSFMDLGATTSVETFSQTKYGCNSIAEFSDISTFFQNSKAMEYVQSFHSAVSHLENQCGEAVSWTGRKTDQTSASSSLLKSASIDPDCPGIPTVNDSLFNYGWRMAMVDSALNHFNMTRGEAETWALSLPTPRKNTFGISGQSQSQTALQQVAKVAQSASHYEVGRAHSSIPQHERWMSNQFGASRVDHESFKVQEKQGSQRRYVDSIPSLPESGWSTSTINPAKLDHAMQVSGSRGQMSVKYMECPSSDGDSIGGQAYITNQVWELQKEMNPFQSTITSETKAIKANLRFLRMMMMLAIMDIENMVATPNPPVAMAFSTHSYDSSPTQTSSTSQLRPVPRSQGARNFMQTAIPQFQTSQTLGDRRTIAISQDTIARMDKVPIPLSMKNSPTFSKVYPSEIITWGSLKQWILQNQSIPSNSIEAVTRLQNIHYAQVMYSRQQSQALTKSTSGTAHRLPRSTSWATSSVSSPVDLTQQELQLRQQLLSAQGSFVRVDTFTIAPVGQIACNRMIRPSIPGHNRQKVIDHVQIRQPTEQEILKLRNHPSGKLANATDEQIRSIFARAKVANIQSQIPQQKEMGAFRNMMNIGKPPEPGNLANLKPSDRVAQGSSQAPQNISYCMLITESSPFIHIPHYQHNISASTLPLGPSVQSPRWTSGQSVFPETNLNFSTQSLDETSYDDQEHHKKFEDVSDWSEFLSQSQLGQLWWKAFARLRNTDLENGKRLQILWDHPSHPAPTPSLDVAKATQAVKEMMSALSLEQPQLQMDSRGHHNSISALASIGQIRAIALVIQETLKFKFGALVWAWLNAPWREPSMDSTTISWRSFAEIATLIARYNVMESVYHQWSGMCLTPEYESALLDLCAHVLRYIACSCEYPLRELLPGIMANIVEADEVCRGFTVTFYTDPALATTSNDDSDSDGSVEIMDGTKRKLNRILEYEACSTKSSDTGVGRAAKRLKT